MISIIISSSNPEYLSAVKKNIDDTVGIPYEIIAVPNGDGKKGICEVYNAAGAQAKYDVMCFMHEDVILHTQDWGKKVVEIMSDPEIGLLGIAGSTYKTLTPGGWAPPALPPSRYKTNFLQHFKFAEKERIHDYYNSDNESTSQVVTVDGVWMCTRKEIFEQFKFDEQMLKRFHGYDIDYSLQVGSAYKVMVTFDVLLEHFSEGNYSDEWLDAMFLVHEKHKHLLPINIGKLPVKEARYSEKVACKILLKYAADQHYSASDKIKLLWKYDLYRAFGWNRFLLFNLHVLSKRY